MRCPYRIRRFLGSKGFFFERGFIGDFESGVLLDKLIELLAERDDGKNPDEENA
jgi:hypothetical protein